MTSRIMYIEFKGPGIVGPGRIARVRFNRTKRTIFYKDQIFRRIVGGGFKANYIEESSGDPYWISGPKANGDDRMYGSQTPVPIDDDIREEYWLKIRMLPDRIDQKYA